MAKTFDSTRIQVKAVNVIPEKATEVYNHVRLLKILTNMYIIHRKATLQM